jgi:hypothetical protein
MRGTLALVTELNGRDLQLTGDADLQSFKADQDYTVMRIRDVYPGS